MKKWEFYSLVPQVEMIARNHSDMEEYRLACDARPCQTSGLSNKALSLISSLNTDLLGTYLVRAQLCASYRYSTVNKRAIQKNQTI